MVEARFFNLNSDRLIIYQFLPRWLRVEEGSAGNLALVLGLGLGLTMLVPLDIPGVVQLIASCTEDLLVADEAS